MSRSKLPWRQQCHHYIRSQGFGDCGEEYIEEAEHQEGVRYWRQFRSLEELDKDLRLFLEALKDVST